MSVQKLPKWLVMARYIAHAGVRNSELENLHAGVWPSSKKGDYSDVKVVTPYGEIPWNKIGRISDPEMRVLMLNIERQIADCLHTLDLWGDEQLPDIQEHLFEQSGVSWDDPRLDEKGGGGGD